MRMASQLGSATAGVHLHLATLNRVGTMRGGGGSGGSLELGLPVFETEWSTADAL